MSLIRSGFAVILLHIAVVADVAADESDPCSISTTISGTLGDARSLFRSVCSTHTVKDCDPIKGGGWQCSSNIIGAGAAASSTARRQTDTSTVEPAVKPAAKTITPVAEPTNQLEQCYAVGTTLDDTHVEFAQQCATFQRHSCNPIGENRWVCSSAEITQPEPDDASEPDIITTVTPSTVVDPNADITSAEVDSPVSDSFEQTTIPNTTKVGRLDTNDLLVLHYDHCPDRDDGHAIPADKSVTEKYGINNVLVVNGTCGNSIRDRFNSASNAVVKASWGDQYLDAHAQYATSVQTAVTRWASTLSNGASVWVSEGGQSDFTADVVRNIESQFSNLSLTDIHVVQHSTGSTGYNEKFTDSANLAYLKSKISYRVIDNGNVGGNGTADLKQQSNYFLVSARSSRFGTEWGAAFAYLQPDCSEPSENCKLDFSDTVAVLYIVDDTRTNSVNDFANNYLN